ncbi:MAG: DNA polymerase IV [Bacteroidetes bacterium]|nr:DNA polymerase IV [Bacteroidota bacterium]
MKTIFHLDMDAFFVSVERILDPSLEGKPVIVGGDPHGRGVVAACSYEARKYGLHSAMPIKTAFRLCPNGIYLHGHHKEYGRYSRVVKRLLEKVFPIVERASIDEFYLDFTGCEKIYGAPDSFAERIQKEIWETIGLPCSIGIASNKTVAKIASDFKKPKGITFVPHGKEKEFLAPLKIEKIPGIGKATFNLLHSRGFITVNDIANVSQDYLSILLGKYGTDLWKKANGHGTDLLSVEHERKSISKETTFGKDIVSKTKIESVIFELVGEACQLLRNEMLQTSTVSIKLRYADFSTLTRAKTIKQTDDDKVVYDAAVDLFRKSLTRGVGIRLIGIHLSKLSQFAEQEILFEDEEIIRKKMLSAVTKIRDKYGFESIHIGKTEND